MKTQGTKLVARIAVALLAGMMVLALASCGSKNPLKGHTYVGRGGADKLSLTFSEKEAVFTWSDANGEYDDMTETATYTLDSGTKTVTAVVHDEDGAEGSTYFLSYEENGLSVSLDGLELKRVK